MPRRASLDHLSLPFRNVGGLPPSPTALRGHALWRASSGLFLCFRGLLPPTRHPVCGQVLGPQGWPTALLLLTRHVALIPTQVAVNLLPWKALPSPPRSFRPFQIHKAQLTGATALGPSRPLSDVSISLGPSSGVACLLIPHPHPTFLLLLNRFIGIFFFFFF